MSPIIRFPRDPFHSDEYKDYMLSPEWQDFREYALEAADYLCKFCERSPPEVTLQVHHLHYATLGHESLDDVLVVCRDCHQRIHAQRRGNHR